MGCNCKGKRKARLEAESTKSMEDGITKAMKKRKSRKEPKVEATK